MATITGTPGPDALIGTDDDQVLGTGGDDVINGLDGNDTFDGLGGINQIDAGLGDDLINITRARYISRDETSTIQGGSGFDTVDSSSLPAATLSANNGGTFLTFGDRRVAYLIDGVERLVTGAGDDTIDAIPTGLREIFTGSGNDRITLWSDRTYNDVTSHAGLGNDFIWAAGSAYGEEGNDSFYFASGPISTVYDGGSGFNTLYVTPSSDRPDAIDLQAEKATKFNGDLIKTIRSFQQILIFGSPTALSSTVSGSGANETFTILYSLSGPSMTAATFYGRGGDDMLSGADANDTLDGGDGNDRLSGGPGFDQLFGGAGDDILDGSTGNGIISGGEGIDRAVFAYASPLASFTIGAGYIDVSNSQTGETQRVSGVEFFDFTDRSISESNLTQTARAGALADFNSDTQSDLLWRNGANGTFTTWTLSGGPGIVASRNSYTGEGVGLEWSIRGTFDFTGDGKSDILWRHANGSFTVWGSTGSGFVANVYADGSVTTDWTIAALGDFNADGRGDILWRNVGGSFTTWLSTGTAFAQNAYTNNSVGTDWHLVQAADFTGDGRADLLWRNDNGFFTQWDARSDNQFTINSYQNGSVGLSWHLVAAADFTGDGKADLLWRNEDGTLTQWSASSSGFIQNTFVSTTMAPSWQVDQTGDYNGDGKADIFWRNTQTGASTIWASAGVAPGSDHMNFQPDAFTDNSVEVEWSLQHFIYDYV